MSAARDSLSCAAAVDVVGHAGGLFDPFGFSRGDEKIYQQYKVKEIKNARLAMVAFVGERMVFCFGGGTDGERVSELRWLTSHVLRARPHAGFIAQHHATGKSPIDNLIDHVSNPTKVTFATNGVSVPHFTEFN